MPNDLLKRRPRPFSFCLSLLAALGSFGIVGCESDRVVVTDRSSELPTTAPAIVSPVVTRVLGAGNQIGSSRNGRPIRLIAWSRCTGQPAKPFDDHSLTSAAQFPQRVLIFAGIHGSETTTVYAAAQLINLIQQDPNSAIPENTAVFIVPVANPDGYALRRRTNSAGVDLNRNFPASNFKSTPRGTGNANNWPGSTPLSEPESRAIHSLVLRLQPTRILALHSIRTRRHGNNYDGPARPLAELLASHNHYDVLPTIGYDTPGSFGSWAGIDRQIPTITLEFPGTASNEKAWADNRDALLAFIRGR